MMADLTGSCRSTSTKKRLLGWMNWNNAPKFWMGQERHASRFTVDPGCRILTFISRERSWRWNTQVLAFTISCAIDDFRSLSETCSLYRIIGTFRSFGCSVKPCSKRDQTDVLGRLWTGDCLVRRCSQAFGQGGYPPARRCPCAQPFSEFRVTAHHLRELTARYPPADDALLQEFVPYLKVAPCHRLLHTRELHRYVRSASALDNPS
jgi:hypothetical protein